MPVFALVNFEGIIPATLAALLDRIPSARTDGHQLFIYDLDNWQAVVGEIRRHGSSCPKRVRAVLVETDAFGGSPAFDWQSPRDEWIGAVLDADPNSGGRSCNPTRDYESPLPEPCRGHVRRNVPILVAGRLKGHVCRVGEDLVFSHKMLSLLRRPANGQLGDVLRAGKPLPGWKRFFPEERCAVIAQTSVLPDIDCTACHTRLTPFLGVWIAQDSGIPPQGIAVEDLGFQHLSQSHPIVVSLHTADVIHQNLGSRGYQLNPVYKWESPTATLVRRCRDDLELM